ncbi:flagellar brake protein [Sporosarcina pasteurii]|uniref:Predicted glycosyltransferase n=1 Tax=Sporosarcina pasteurii TaxID=1474 RepID=A0A380BJQ0_SPOPA|nr:flagellar brake domain-containing protein [Sporosarcina pasteurii]MDS9470806.1 PilZ domain-containing protein [Sporosarcina pasteurii]SUJ02373.1 Predicted glycosyltransferase [Sporosarcina pasteurii]
MTLKVGTVVIIEKKFSDDNSKYRSKIIDSGDGFVMIDYPTHIDTGKTAFFMDGTELVINFTDDLRMSYAFHTVVCGRQIDGVPMLKIAYEGDEGLIRIQRRQFVRVKVAIDVAVEIEDHVMQLVTEDISAGGVAINITNTSVLQKEAVVSLLLVLPFVKRETQYVRAKGRVIRIWEDGRRKIASLEFVEISTVDRQQIVQFCFERQLQMKNK